MVSTIEVLKRNSMTFVDTIRSKADFLGVFVAADDFTTIKFYSPHTNEKGKGLYTHFNEYGDCVYFMFVGDRLMKIGKAAGGNGWIGRAQQYKRGLRGDNTNKLILSTLKNENRYVIEILGIQTQRVGTNIVCPLTGDKVQSSIETAETLEKFYTQQYLDESEENELPFCRQLK